MPVATNNIEDLQHFDLTTCPGGYVKLRRMSYGQYLKRQAMAMDMQMRQEGRGRGASSVLDIDVGQEKVTQFEFATCVAEHNLTDANENPLDFKNPGHVQMLDPRVGQEIGDCINKINVYEEEAAGN
jgi:hypothetical protein